MRCEMQKLAMATLGVLSMLALRQPAMASEPPELREFIDAHICIVVERLRMIRAAPREPEKKNRYLTVQPVDDVDVYAQCIFFENDTKAYCEAASGRFSGATEQSRRLRLAPGAHAALAALGFDTTTDAGNFRPEVPVPNEGAVRGIA